MQNPFSFLAHIFKHAAVWVKDEFVKVFSSDVAKTFAVGALGLLKSNLGKIAIEAVTAASTLTSDGAGRRQAAFDQLAKDAKASGIQVKDSILNLLIESALQFIKGSFGPGDAPPAA